MIIKPAFVKTGNTNSDTGFPNKRKRHNAFQDNSISNTKRLYTKMEPKVCETNNTNYIKNEVMRNRDILDEIINTEILHNLRTRLNGFPPEESYACANCGEMFLSKRGCDHHLNRTSVHIIHKCSYCAKTLEFYNRCSFLLHIKGHGINPSKTYLRSTTDFKVVEESRYLYFGYGDASAYDHTSQITKVESIQNENTGELLEMTFGEKIGPKSDNGSLTSCSADTPLLGQSRKDIGDNNAQSQHEEDISSSGKHDFPEPEEIRCTSCQKVFFSPDDFSSHLQDAEKVGASSQELYHCEIHDVYSFSQCKHFYHTKLFHDKSCPFICPECGQVFEKWEVLYHHARFYCFHMSRAVRYICVMKNCGGDGSATGRIFEKNMELLSHMGKEHCRFVLQCLYCTRAFATWEWLFKHLLNDKHNIALSVSITQQLSSALEPSSPIDTDGLARSFSKSLIQCLICNIVFYTSSSYQQHLSVKFSDHSKIKMVYVCRPCSQEFYFKNDLKSHMEDYPNCKITFNESESSAELPTKSIATSKSSKLSSRSYRPRPVPLRVQPARAVSIANIPNIPNPNYVLSSSVNGKGASSRAHITQQCRHCRQTFDLNLLKKHESSCSKSQLDPGYCLACKQNHQGSSLLWYHGKNHLKSGISVCLFCNNMEITDKVSQGESNDEHKALEDHLMSQHVSLTKLPFKCLLCKETVADKDAVYSHLKKHHDLSTIDSFQIKRCRNLQWSQPQKNHPKKGGIANGLRQQSQENLKEIGLSLSSSNSHSYVGVCNKRRKTINENETADDGDICRDQCDTLHNEKPEQFPKKDPEKANSASIDFKPIAFVPLLTNSTSRARTAEGTFLCFKCPDFCASTESDFCDHIRSSHILSDQEEERHYNGGVGIFPVEFLEFWCPECDISFVVKPSLVKHIQLSHEYICDVGEYMRKVGYDSKRPVKENQCEICYLRCVDSTEHVNHMKSHGMAFLRLKQQRTPSN